MAALDLSAASNILKIDYEGPIRRQLNDSQILLKRAQRDTERWAGKNVIVPLSTSRNAGVGARGDGGTLPTAGKQSYAQLSLNAKYNYGRIKVTGPTIASSRNNTASFVRAVDSEIRGMMRDLRRDISRQLYNDAHGAIATCGATSADTDVVLASDTNMNNFYIGQVIDVVAASSGTAVSSGSGLTISAIDKSAKTITVGTAITTTSSDIVVNASAYEKEILGLEAWIDSTSNTVGGINRSTAGNEYFQPQVLGNSGTNRALSLDLMQQAQDAAEAAVGATIGLAITSQGVRRKYVSLVRADRRFVNEMTLDGGFKAVEFNGYGIVVDTQAPFNRMYFLDESSYHFYVLQDFQWMDKDGAVLSRVSGEDAYEAVLTHYAELGFEIPAANATLADISE